MTQLRMLLPVTAAALLAACADRAQPTTPTSPDGPRLAASATTAEIEFGREVGSPFPPQIGHDASGHAADKLNPRTVTIARGGTVTFHIDPFHAVAIYRAGTEPDDIEVSPATLHPLVLGPVFIPDFVIDDPHDRIAQGPGYSFVEQHWTSPPFTQAGRYLVICKTTPHFLQSNMYSWIIVK